MFGEHVYSAYKLFYDWWASHRGEGGALPSVDICGPAELEAALGSVADWFHLMRRTDGGAVMVEHLGPLIRAAPAGDLVGQDYLSVFQEDQRLLLREYFDHICLTPCGAYLDQQVVHLDGVENHFRHLDLPLQDASGVSHVCGISRIVFQKIPDVKETRELATSHFQDFKDFDLNYGPKVEKWEVI